MKVIIDSREKIADSGRLEFKVGGNISEVIVRGVPFGDYWCQMEDGHEIPIMFEKKSMADLYQTLSNEDGIRLHKEKIRKAEEMDCKLYCIIEGSLTDAYKGVGYSQVEPGPLVKRIFTFKVKYGFEPVFCTSRKEMMDFMIETWEAFGRNFKHLKVADADRD